MKRLLAVLFLLALPSALHAAPDEDALERAAERRASEVAQVLMGEKPAEAVFASSFLKEVPPVQLAALVSDLVKQSGDIRTVDDFLYQGDGAAKFDLVFEKARGAASIQLDRQEPYLVTGFRIYGVTPTDDTPQKILADFAALPGETGFAAYMLDKDGLQPILTNKAHRQMAIGSTIKLYVLSALAQEISAGKRRWGDVVALEARSIPSGRMQDWPPDAPVTLQTLATMMISISDNTATDTLMRLLGREAIEREVIASGHSDPSRTLPLLTTIELFALKTGDPARIAAYAKADDAAQAALLSEWAPSLTREHVALGKLIGSSPNAIDSVEWFASAEDIARILQRLRDGGDPVVLQILGVNPSIVPHEQAYWDYVGYKGGSEPGVLNFSWLLKDKQGRWFVIAASWNDPAKNLEAGRLEQLAMRLMGMLHR